MKSYLCIGGPLHGERKDVREGTLIVAVPVCCGQDYIGIEALDAFAPRIRETRYNLKTIADRQSKEVTVDDTRSTVTIDTRTDVLVHESILTFEETVAYHRKLTGAHSRQVAISRALAQLKF